MGAFLARICVVASHASSTKREDVNGVSSMALGSEAAEVELGPDRN